MTQRLSTITQTREGSARGGWMLAVVQTPASIPVPRIFRINDVLVPIDRKAQPGADGLVIADPAISNGRTVLHQVTDGYELEDRGARNPIRVNGERITRRLLAANDVIRVGNTLMVVERDDPARSARRSGAFDDPDIAPLVERLQLHESTASCRFRVDVSLDDPDAALTVVWSPCPVSCRATGRWLATRRARTLVAVPGDAPDAVERVRSAAPDATTVVERVDLVPRAALRELVEALERRIEKDLPIAVTLDAATSEVPPGPIAQLLALRSGTELRVPPLAVRKLDLLSAVSAYMDAAHDQSSRELTPDVAERLLVHDWPTGLGELKQVAERLARAVARGSGLTEAVLPPGVGMLDPEPEDEGPKALSRDVVWEAFLLNNGQAKQVARYLGLSRSHFYRRMKELDIDLQEMRDRYEAEVARLRGDDEAP